MEMARRALPARMWLRTALVLIVAVTLVRERTFAPVLVYDLEVVDAALQETSRTEAHVERLVRVAPRARYALERNGGLTTLWKDDGHVEQASTAGLRRVCALTCASPGLCDRVSDALGCADRPASGPWVSLTGTIDEEDDFGLLRFVPLYKRMAVDWRSALTLTVEGQGERPEHPAPAPEVLMTCTGTFTLSVLGLSSGFAFRERVWAHIAQRTSAEVERLGQAGSDGARRHAPATHDDPAPR